MFFKCLCGHSVLCCQQNKKFWNKERWNWDVIVSRLKCLPIKCHFYPPVYRAILKQINTTAFFQNERDVCIVIHIVFNYAFSKANKILHANVITQRTICSLFTAHWKLVSMLPAMPFSFSGVWLRVKTRLKHQCKSSHYISSSEFSCFKISYIPCWLQEDFLMKDPVFFIVTLSASQEKWSVFLRLYWKDQS